MNFFVDVSQISRFEFLQFGKSAIQLWQPSSCLGQTTHWHRLTNPQLLANLQAQLASLANLQQKLLFVL